MFCRSVCWLICISVVAVIASNYSDPDSIAGSDPEATVYRSNTENPEWSTTGAVQKVKEIAAVDLGVLLDAGEGATVTLAAGDTRLVVHRAVLAARSPAFAAIFDNDTLEGNSVVVTVTDVEGPVLRQLVAYMYSLQAPQLPSMAPQLLAAADRFGLSALKAVCEQQVAAQLSVDTAAATALLAVRHSSGSLRQATIAFIRAHIFQVMSSQGWAQAMHTHPEDLIQVLQLLANPLTETSAPPPATAVGSGTTPTPTAAPSTQAHSSQTAASAAPPTAARHTATTEDPAVSRLRSLSDAEKNRRLIQAAEEGTVEELRALLAAGADVRATEDVADWTALHEAAWKGHVEVASVLLKNGAEVEARSVSDSTPLHFAAKAGHTAVVRLLLVYSANPNARRLDGVTPLHFAAERGYAEIAAILLAAGADSEAGSDYGETPLDLARRNNHQQLINILT